MFVYYHHVKSVRLAGAGICQFPQPQWQMRRSHGSRSQGRFGAHLKPDAQLICVIFPD